MISFCVPRCDVIPPTHTPVFPLPASSYYLFILINYSCTVYQSIKVRNLIVSTSTTRQLLIIKQTSQGRSGDFLTLLNCPHPGESNTANICQLMYGERGKVAEFTQSATWPSLTEHSLFSVGRRSSISPRPAEYHWSLSASLMLQQANPPITPIRLCQCQHQDKVGLLSFLWLARHIRDPSLLNWVTVNKSLTFESLFRYQCGGETGRGGEIKIKIFPASPHIQTEKTGIMQGGPAV